MRKLAIVGSVVVWSALVVAGAGMLYAYEGTPGERGVASTTWPAASKLPRAGITIAMFVEPGCPCTRASLSELSRVIAATPPATLVFVVEGDPAPIAEELATFSGAHVVRDPEGVEAARFGAKTSGHVVAYDGRGSLAFAGGITPARGHVGDNMGRRGLERVLAGEAAPDPARAVLSCALKTR